MPFSNPNQPFPLLYPSMLFEAAVSQRGTILWAVRTLCIFHIYIYIHPDPLFCILSILKVLHPESSWGVSILGNESRLNSGTCIRLMLNSSVLHGPAGGAAHVGQSVVSDYGLLHAWLFPLLAMAIPPTTSIPSCHMFWNPLYFYKHMGKAVFCHGWHRI